MNKIIIGSLLFVGFYNLLFYPTVIGIGLGVLFAGLHIYLFSVRTNHVKTPFLAVGLSILSVFFATAIGLRANWIVQAIDLLVALFLSVCAAYFYKKEKQYSWGIFSFFIVPFAALGESLISGYGFLTHNNVATHAQSNKSKYYSIFRGVAIALPVLYVLYVLLSRADPIFAGLFRNLSFSLSTQATISLSLFTLGFFWGITKVKDRFLIKNSEKQKIGKKEDNAIEALIVTGSAALLFAVFLYIQIEYLFLQVPETQLQHLGINIKTYSEYVRQGFFQLLIAAGIATSIVACFLQTIHIMAQKQKFYVQLSMILLTLETEFLLISAAKRLYLYADAHGLTRSRIFGIVFLVWLSAVLILMLIGTVKQIKRMYFFISFFLITLVAFVSINILSIDSIIATSYPPTVNKEIDYVYIARLSPDAASSWPSIIQRAQVEWDTLAKLTSPSDDQTRKVNNLHSALTLLRGNVFELDRKYTTDPKKYMSLYTDTENGPDASYARWKEGNLVKTWQAFNISEYQAYRVIQQNLNLFNQIQPLIMTIAQKEQDWSDARDKVNQKNR